MILMIVNLCSIWAIVYRLLLLHVSLSREIKALVNSHIHFLDEYTVCRDTVSLLDINNISDNKVSDLDRCARAEGSSINRNILVIDLVLQFEVLGFLDVVACC